MLENAFEAAPSSLRPDTMRDAIEGWDSMGALALMAEFDSHFNLELTAEQSRSLRSIADVIEYLRAHGALLD